MSECELELECSVSLNISRHRMGNVRSAVNFTFMDLTNHGEHIPLDGHQGSKLKTKSQLIILFTSFTRLLKASVLCYKGPVNK